MMENFPVLDYRQLWQVMCLRDYNDWNGTVVDDAALEVMLRIEKTMQRLKPMGEDDRRVVWIRIKAPSRRYRMERADREGYYWYQLCTAHYEDFHYLLMSNREYHLVDLRSAKTIGSERVPDVWKGNVSEALQQIEAYVEALVDAICRDSEAYNRYVEAHLPYEKRKGRIERRELNRICPSYRTFEKPEKVLRILRKRERMA